MALITHPLWHPDLYDPTGKREFKPRTGGKTMVIDKGLGIRAFRDLVETAAAHIDMIKIGFGTTPLYPQDVLDYKIRLAKDNDICIYPGGTFLEVAVNRGLIDDFFETVTALGFNGVEVSDGTIDIDPRLRKRLILKGIENGLRVFTEYGKKCWGSRLEIDELVETVISDVENGAELVTIEGRESGTGVGIFDEHGNCRDDEIMEVIERVQGRHLLLWEAPQKEQQVHLLKMLGSGVHIGNVAPQDIFSLEALRRGLRSDTFHQAK